MSREWLFVSRRHSDRASCGVAARWNVRVAPTAGRGLARLFGVFAVLAAMVWVQSASAVEPLAAPLAFAQATGPEQRLAPSDARAWLAQVKEATTRRNYQGVFVVTLAGTTRSARVVQYWHEGQSFQRIETLDGQAKRILRHNEWVQIQWPQERVVNIEQRAWLPSFPAFLNSARSLAVTSDSAASTASTAAVAVAGAVDFTEFYEVQWLGRDRLAGLDASVVWLKPRDRYRHGLRLWSEAKSGLLLRADLLNPGGEVLASSGFSEVSLDVRPQPQEVLRAMSRLEGYRVTRPVVVRTRLDAEGWQLKSAVPGFVPVQVFRRSLPPADPGAPAGDAAADSSDVLQAIFSDGLSAVSVFLEPFNAKVHTRAVQTTLGATQTLMRRQGDWWVTAVGDVPAVTLASLAQAFERRR